MELSWGWCVRWTSRATRISNAFIYVMGLDVLSTNRSINGICIGDILMIIFDAILALECM
jgi:hypothetical protein